MANWYATRSFTGSRFVGGPEQPTTGTNCSGAICIQPDRMILLHGFIKKTQKTPQHDMDLALKRQKGAAT